MEAGAVDPDGVQVSTNQGNILSVQNLPPINDTREGSVTTEIGKQAVSYSTSTSNSSNYKQQDTATVPYEQSLQYWRDRQKPVKEKNLKLYKIISIIAIIAFFPLGIPAFWVSLKLEKDFYDGLEKGDLSTCNKRAILLNKLLILSFTLCLFMVILILAIIGGTEGERAHSTYTNNGVHL